MNEMYSMDTFEAMIDDWLADHAEEMCDLEIDGIDQEEGCYSAAAHDDGAAYLLTDGGDGNIVINYICSRR